MWNLYGKSVIVGCCTVIILASFGVSITEFRWWSAMLAMNVAFNL